MSEGSPDESPNERPSRPGPHADVLREYDEERRRRTRKKFKAAHDDRAAEKQARRDERYRRRARRAPFMRWGIRLVGLLPLAVAAWFGERLGAALYRFRAVARHRALFQLKLAFPEKTDSERNDIARSAFGLMGRGAVSLPTLRRQGVERLLQRVEVVDDQLIREALDGGKGVILVTFHFGPFEAGGVWLAHAWNVIAVGRDAGTLDATQHLIDIREDLGLTTIERGDARAIVRALRDNRPVGILADHDIASLNGVFVPFFGHLAHTPLGPAALAVRTGAPIVPLMNEWVGRTSYRVRVLDLLRPRDDLSRDDAAHELTYRFTKIGEEAIRARPDHWLWLHKRWESTPERRPELPVWRPAEGPDSNVGT